MSVTERVMVAGAWAVDLTPETPGQLMEQIALSRAGFAQIEILPAHLDPREHSDETLLGLARYTGLYRSQEGTYRLSGPGLPVLLGDEEGKADIAETAISTPNGWLSQWVPALRPITLRSGTVTSPAPRSVANVCILPMGMWVVRKRNRNSIQAMSAAA